MEYCWDLCGIHFTWLKRGGCRHCRCGKFDCHSFCVRCRDKGKCKDRCIEKPHSTDCKFCNSLTEDQHVQLATPSYKLKKEKRDAKKMEASSTPNKDSASLVDPATVSVIGAVNVQGDLQSPSGSEPSSKKPKKDKPTTSKTKTVKPESKLATDSKIAELNQKWSDRFNHLEVLLMARTLELTFSTVKVRPTHSPPAGAVKNTEPFMKLTQPATASSEFPGSDSSAVKH